MSEQRLRVLLAGASGTIGQAVRAELIKRGHTVICLGRTGLTNGNDPPVRAVDFADVASITDQGFRGERFDALISCMASRTGAAQDAWAVDYTAHCNLLAAAKSAGTGRFVLLSSICVQKPALAFQQAKLAFEQELAGSGMPHSIVRPTAYFKSLSGQVARIKQGKPYLMFGHGDLTACQPISDKDLARFLADCAQRADAADEVLPIGGPGPPITPRQIGDMLFRLTGRKPRFRRVPVWLLDAIAAALAVAGRFSAAAAQKAELARIGKYYATESMLLLDVSTGQYDAEVTPSFGSDRFEDHLALLVSGEITHQASDHSVF